MGLSRVPQCRAVDQLFQHHHQIFDGVNVHQVGDLSESFQSHRNECRAHLTLDNSEVNKRRFLQSVRLEFAAIPRDCLGTAAFLKPGIHPIFLAPLAPATLLDILARGRALVHARVQLHTLHTCDVSWLHLVIHLLDVCPHETHRFVGDFPSDILLKDAFECVLTQLRHRTAWLSRACHDGLDQR